MKTLSAVVVLAAAVPTAVLLAPSDRGTPGSEPGPRVEDHGRMTAPRAAHQATGLPDGRVLVTGGCTDPGCERMVATAEIYDPADRSFRAVAPMSLARGSHNATILPDGRVLVTGGWTPEGPAGSVEIYDPETDRWTPGPDMVAARVSHNATRLPGGRILLVAGDGPPGTAELFDPDGARFVPGPPLVEDAGAYLPTALSDGRVLVTGGATAETQIFDPTTETFVAAGSLASRRTKHAAALLPDGRVLLVGGSGGGGYRDRVATTEIFDPDDGSFSPGPALVEARFKIRDAVVTLPGGAVLVAGGAPSTEVLDPGAGAFEAMQGSFGAPRMFATATPLPRGEVLVLGGYDTDIRPTASAWLYRPGR